MGAYSRQEAGMNHTIHFHPQRQQHHDHHWLKELQFAAGIIVALGGAAVLLSELVGLLGQRF